MLMRFGFCGKAGLCWGGTGVGDFFAQKEEGEKGRRRFGINDLFQKITLRVPAKVRDVVVSEQVDSDALLEETDVKRSSRAA